MEKEYDYLYEEEEKTLKAPYYVITYIDDESQTHMAMVKDNTYANYLKDRFIVKDCQQIGEFKTEEKED